MNGARVASRPSTRVRRARQRVSGAPRALKLLMLVGLVNALAWAAIVAPLTGPDEDNHASYIIHLAETGGPPSVGKGSSTHSTQTEYLLAGAQLRTMINNAGARPDLSHWDTLARQMDAAPQSQRDNGDGPNPIAKNSPLYYYLGAAVYELSPDRSLPGRLFAIRAMTTLLMPAMVLLAWLIAAEMFAAGWARMLTAAMVALQPKLAFMAGTINPDMLMITLFTATVLFGLRLAKGELTAKNGVLVGLCAGACVLTHGRGFAAVPIALLALAIGLEKVRPPIPIAVRKVSLSLAALLLPVIIALVYTRVTSDGSTSSSAFGGEVSQATSSLNMRQFLSYVWQFYLPRLDFMVPPPGAHAGYRQIFIVGFFGEQGGLDINFARPTFGLIQMIAGFGLLAFFVIAVRKFELLVARWRQVVLLLGSILSLMVLLHVSEYRDLLGGADALLAGRYILPIVVLYGLAITFVAWALRPRLRAILIGASITAGLMLSIGALTNAVERLSG